MKSKISIKIKLFASLSKNKSGIQKSFKIRKESTITKLIEFLDINLNDVKLIFVNGVAKNFKYKLKDGDNISIFPPIGGG